MEDATETIEALLDVFHAENVDPAKEPVDSGVAFGGESPIREKKQSSASSSSGPIPECGRGSSMISMASDEEGGDFMGRKRSLADQVEDASHFGCHPECIGHEVFGIEYVDLVKCSFCQATSEPVVASSFLYRIYVAELLAAKEQQRSSRRGTGLFSAFSGTFSGGDPAPNSKLVDIMWDLCQHPLDGKCKECNSLRTVSAQRWLTRRPLTFMLSLVWPTGNPTRDQLLRVLYMIQPEFRMQSIFRTEGVARPSRLDDFVHRDCRSASDLERSEGGEERYTFRGLICYRGLHYTALFWCLNRMKWVLYDDDCVRDRISWNHALNFIVNEQYVPTLLFYECLSGSTATTDSVEEVIRQITEVEESAGPCAIT
jgi:hypothetical protein